jgi:hypothetical protein
MTSFPGAEQPHCPVCGSAVLLELYEPAGARLCPRCGLLLDWFRQWLGRTHGPARARILLDSRLVEDLGVDSLDLVELALEVEDRFGVEVLIRHEPEATGAYQGPDRLPELTERALLLDEEEATVETVADLIRRIARGQDERPEES